MSGGSELSSGEKKFVFDLEGVDPDFVLWVKKTNKKDVVQDRLFVLTKYRVYSIKRTKVGGKKKVQRQGHLYDLVDIRTDDIDRVVLKFTTFSIDISGSSTGITIPKLLINSFHRISFTFSQAALPNLLILPSERSQPEIDPVDPGPAHGFIEVYKAQCNYYGTPVNNDLIDYITDTVNKGIRVFCLDDFAGIDKNTDGAVNLVPVLAALRHNTFFDTFICHNKTRKEVPALLADVFVHNKTLYRVDLQGIESEEGWVQFGEDLKQNQSNALQYLNISENGVHDRGMNSIGLAIRSFNRQFTELIASKVNLESKGASVFFRTLQGNFSSSGSIVKMDFSKNHIDKIGSESLHDWLILLNSSIPNPKKPLCHLNLEGTDLDTAKITTAIKQANIESLISLNLSNNRMTSESVQNLNAIIAKSDQLSQIKLRHCQLMGENVASILNACSSAVAVHERMVDFSNNSLGKAGALALAPSIKSCSNIHFLKLSQNNFRKKGITYIAQAIEENNTLYAVDISSNFKSNSGADTIVDKLARAFNSHPTIRKLVLAGKDSRGYFLGKDLLPLAKSLNEDCKLEDLDVSGNNMGDDVCRELFEALKKNTSIRVLNIDNNHLGMAGFQAMKRTFTTNRTLIDIPVPTSDITRILSLTSQKDKKTVNDKIGEILVDINTCLMNNKNGVAYSDLPSSTKTTVAISSSTPSFRASTYGSTNSLGDSYGQTQSNGSSSSADQYQYQSYQNGANKYQSTSQPQLNKFSPPPPLYSPPVSLETPPPPPPINNDYQYDDQSQQQYDQSQYDQTQYDDQSQQQYDQTQYDDQSQQQYDQSQYDQSQYDQSQYQYDQEPIQNEYSY